MRKGLERATAALDEPELAAMLEGYEAAAQAAVLPGVVTDDPPDWLATRPRSYRMGPIVWLRQGLRRMRRGITNRLWRPRT